MGLIECVPNISEGRRTDVIREIATCCEAFPSVSLLHVDSGGGPNRTVFTLAGEIDAVEAAASALVERAYQLIDMRDHGGVHPCIGAVDVVPFVPLKDVTISECDQVAKRFAKGVADKFNIPVYLYEESATQPSRKWLANIRKGGYLGLAKKLKDSNWKPDFGPAEFAAELGAIVVGARELLIAYNVTLESTDEKTAREIAGVVKNSWSGKGERPFRVLAWHIDEYDAFQISFNLTDYQNFGLYDAFKLCEREAGKSGLKVSGSELIGLVPLAALESEGNSVEQAIDVLGLELHGKFNAKERVLEYCYPALAS